MILKLLYQWMCNHDYHAIYQIDINPTNRNLIPADIPSSIDLLKQFRVGFVCPKCDKIKHNLINLFDY